MTVGGLMRPKTWSTLTWASSGVLQSFAFDIGSLEARLKLFTLSNGSIHDADAGGPADIKLPYDRRVMAQLKSDVPGTVATNYSAIVSLVGASATMTAEDANANQWTSSMYLKKINADLPRQAITTLLFLEFEMVFTQYTDWVAVP